MRVISRRLVGKLENDTEIFEQLIILSISGYRDARGTLFHVYNFLCFTESHRMDFKETASSSGRKLRKNFTGSGERSASSEIIRYREDE